MIYDCFPFFNELDLLELRLHELDEVVDYFVLVEATRTHSGQPKPLHYRDYQRRFSRWRDRVIDVVVDDMPASPDPWVRERHQRESIGRGLAGASAEDVILVSDLDEIPRASKVCEYRDVPGIKVFQQRLCYYFLNLAADDPWPGTRMLSCETFRELGGAQAVRSAAGVPVPEGGWHFSFMGGVGRIRGKLGAYAHQEYNTDRYTDPRHLSQVVRAGVDLFGRDMQWRICPAADLPPYVLQNRARFRDWIYREPLLPEPAGPGRQCGWLVDLYQQVKHLSGDVAAIGCSDPGSLVALANACHPEPLWAVDDWSDSLESAPGENDASIGGGQGPYAAFLHALRVLTPGNARPIILRAEDFLRGHDTAIKLCCLGAPRSVGDLFSVVSSVRERMTPGGILCGVEPPAQGQGIRPAVDELLPGCNHEGGFWSWRVSSSEPG